MKGAARNIREANFPMMKNPKVKEAFTFALYSYVYLVAQRKKILIEKINLIWLGNQNAGIRTDRSIDEHTQCHMRKKVFLFSSFFWEKG